MRIIIDKESEKWKTKKVLGARSAKYHQKICPYAVTERRCKTGMSAHIAGRKQTDPHSQCGCIAEQ